MGMIEEVGESFLWFFVCRKQGKKGSWIYGDDSSSLALHHPIGQSFQDSHLKKRDAPCSP